MSVQRASKREHPVSEETIVYAPYWWSDQPGVSKRRGVRIQRPRGWAFIPDEDIYGVATVLADYLDEEATK